MDRKLFLYLKTKGRRLTVVNLDSGYMSTFLVANKICSTSSSKKQMAHKAQRSGYRTQRNAHYYSTEQQQGENH